MQNPLGHYTPPHKFLGSKQPDYATYACAIETEQCFIRYAKDDWTIDGSYHLENVGGGKYAFRGSVKLDVSEMSPVLQKIKKLWLTFIFFKGDIVVYEERISLKGRANTYIEFSQFIESEVLIESSTIAQVSWQVQGLEAF